MADTDLSKLYKHCNKCGQYTNHTVNARFGKEEGGFDDSDPPQSMNEAHTYLIASCAGCGFTSFRIDSEWDYIFDSEGNNLKERNDYPTIVGRHLPEWLDDLTFDPKMVRFITSIYQAYAAGSMRLVALGLRSLLEEVMIDKVGDQGGLGANIDKFFMEGYVAVKSREIFKDKLIDVGNAAMHRAYEPPAGDLRVLLDITENLLEEIYVNPTYVLLAGMPPKATSKKIPKPN